MHRSITALIAAGLLLLAMAVPAAAVKPEASGPACRDITVTLSYQTIDGTPTATFLFETADPRGTCRGVLYSGFVLDSSGTTLLAEGSTTGDGTNQLGLAVPVTNGPTEVCVYATSGSGPQVWDRAPDTGCVVLLLDPADGGAQRAT